MIKLHCIVDFYKKIWWLPKVYNEFKEFMKKNMKKNQIQNS